MKSIIRDGTTFSSWLGFASGLLISIGTKSFRDGFFFRTHIVVSALKDTRNLGKFNYRQTEINAERLGTYDYGPKDWGLLQCMNPQFCLGWADTFDNSLGWDINSTNHCQWCPQNESHTCGLHHQSPINLERNRAIENDPNEYKCVDAHYMAYSDSSCSFDELRAKNAFVIERYALKIIQPINKDILQPVNKSMPDGDLIYALDCVDQPRSSTSKVTASSVDNAKFDSQRRWGRIDFASGFPEWWFLSHIDFHVPSEHTQEGKRYSGEIQMYHFYSANSSSPENNEMATVAIFLEEYDDADDWPELNKVICAWREREELTRKSCGLQSVSEHYKGCSFYNRTGTNSTANSNTSASDGANASDPNENSFNATTFDANEAGKNTNVANTNSTSEASGISSVNITSLNATKTPNSRTLGLRHPPYDTEFEGSYNKFTSRSNKPATSAYDLIMESYHQDVELQSSYRVSQINTQEHNGDQMDDSDWSKFVASQYDMEENRNKSRRLDNYDNVRWFNYFPMTEVKTEYYFRYSGSQTVPPCFGKWILNDRRQTNHWRVMKDPIRVSPRQIREMHRLIRERIAPIDDPLQSCQTDTGAAVDPEDPKKVSVARPLQSFSKPHFLTFCECKDWESNWKEDRRWCNQTQAKRLYERPYNFRTNGF